LRYNEIVAQARGRIRGWVVRLGRVALVVYLGLVLVLSALQKWMIFPGASTQGQKQACIRPMAGTELVELKAATGQKVVALFGAALDSEGKRRADAPSRATVLYFYGNGMCLADCFSEFNHLRKLGFNVMIPEFLGYGMSEGSASEDSVYATAEAAWEHLVSRSDVDQKKVIVAGWSLGSAAAIELAATKPVAGLMTFSAFSSMKEMARRVLPWAPTSLMLKHHFENEVKLRKVKCPVLIVHGREDDIVPFDMSEKLKGAAGKVRYVPVDGARHNDLFEVGNAELWREVAEFVGKAVE